jgi:hypothetical protein
MPKGDYPTLIAAPPLSITKESTDENPMEEKPVKQTPDKQQPATANATDIKNVM